MRIIAILSLVLFSCNNTSTTNVSTQKAESNSNSKKLYMLDIYDKTNEGTKKRVYEYNKDYLSIDLNSLTDGGYSAGNDIIADSDENGIITIHLEFISSGDTTEMIFRDKTEFLNHMSECGYKLVTEIPIKYGSKYTFAKS